MIRTPAPRWRCTSRDARLLARPYSRSCRAWRRSCSCCWRRGWRRPGWRASSSSSVALTPLSWANRWSSGSRGCYRRPILCCFGHWNRPISIVAIRPPGAPCCTASWRPEVSTGTWSTPCSSFDPACDLQGNLLLEAARLGDCYAVMALLRSGRVDANATDEQGMNCLHHLCREPWVEQRDAVREAIDHGVELSRPSVLGTPLWLALKHSPRVVPMLREAGAISAPGPDSYSGNPVDDLLVAIEHEDAARFAERVAQCSEETVLYQAAVIAACHLRDGFLQILLSRITEARPGLATQVEGQLLFNRIWQPPVDASRAAAVSWLLLESGGLHDLDLSALNFGPFVLHDAKTALTFIQAIVAAGGRVADARVLLNAPQARQLAEQLPTLDRYLASLMELGLDVRHLIRLVEDEPAREALLLRSAQLGHSIEAIGRFIKQFFITDNPRLLELLLGSRLQRPEVQQEIWLHLLYAPPYGAWQRFDPGQKFLAPLVGAGLDINFPVQVFDSRMASTPLQLARQFDQTRTISYLEKLGAAETLPGTPA